MPCSRALAPAGIRPIRRTTRRLRGRACGAGDFGTDAVTGDQNNCVLGHDRNFTPINRTKAIPQGEDQDDRSDDGVKPVALLKGEEDRTRRRRA